MRIHLSLDPSHLAQPVAGPSSGPLVNIGGDLVLIELQGELDHEGDKADGVVGILGLDRPVRHRSLDYRELKRSADPFIGQADTAPRRTPSTARQNRDSVKTVRCHPPSIDTERGNFRRSRR